MGNAAVTAVVAAFPGEDGQVEVHVEVRKCQISLFSGI